MVHPARGDARPKQRTDWQDSHDPWRTNNALRRHGVQPFARPVVRTSRSRHARPPHRDPNRRTDSSRCPDRDASISPPRFTTVASMLRSRTRELRPKSLANSTTTRQPRSARSPASRASRRCRATQAVRPSAMSGPNPAGCSVAVSRWSAGTTAARAVGPRLQSSQEGTPTYLRSRRSC